MAGMVTAALRLPPPADEPGERQAAKQDYRAGLAYTRRNSTVDKALPLLEHAVAADPDSPLTWAGLAEAQWFKYFITKDPALAGSDFGIAAAGAGPQSRSGARSSRRRIAPRPMPALTSRPKRSTKEPSSWNPPTAMPTGGWARFTSAAIAWIRLWRRLRKRWSWIRTDFKIYQDLGTYLSLARRPAPEPRGYSKNACAGSR